MNAKMFPQISLQRLLNHIIIGMRNERIDEFIRQAMLNSLHNCESYFLLGREESITILGIRFQQEEEISIPRQSKNR
jgi:hypothetical protein